MTYVHEADRELIEKIVSDYPETSLETPPQYADHLIRTDGCTITIYASGKVVFQGADADIYYYRYFPLKEMILPQAGSDEVGTGDLFGPVCVCASYVDEAVYDTISHLNIVDSKQLTDNYILQVVPELMEKVPHSLLILDNAKYNEVYPHNNLNRIKARMHNKCFLNLRDKGIKLPELIVIDQFCSEKLYYSYLREEKETVSGIHFETRAENSYISVACGAMIARYGFLKSLEAMGRKYDCVFPKNANARTDSFLKEFAAKYGRRELYRVAKLNFKNISVVLDQQQETLF